MAKLGYVKQHFGVISQSALTTYLTVSKAFSALDVRMVDIDDKVDLCDIAVFNGVKTYLNNVSHVNDSMIAIVCGGPLQINDLNGIVPLDYTKSSSYQFDLRPLDMNLIKQERKANHHIKVSTLNTDHLLLIVDNVVTDGFLLVDYNKVTSVLNATSRNNLRSALIHAVIHDEINFVPEEIVSNPSEEFNERLSVLRKKLKSKKGDALLKAVRESIQPGANIKSILRNSKVEEFELQFFRKMVMADRKKTNPFEPANSTSTISSKIFSTVERPGFMKKSRKHLKEKQR